MSLSAVGLVAVSAVGFEMQPGKNQTQYAFAAVTRDSVVVTLKGTGQVSGENQIDVKPLVSGNVSQILVKSGQDVKLNEPLFIFANPDAQKVTRDAAQSVHDAQISLASAQLSLKKLQEPVDAVSLGQAQDAVNQATRDLQAVKDGPNAYDLASAQATLDAANLTAVMSSDGVTPKIVRNAYDNVVPVLKTTGQSLQAIIMDADSILGIDNTSLNSAFVKYLSVKDTSQLTEANNLYLTAKYSVNQIKTRIDALQTSNENTATIDSVLHDSQDSLNATDALLQKVHDALLATVTAYSFQQSDLDSLIQNVQSDRSTIASKLTSVLSQTQSLQTAKDSYTNAAANVQKAQLALDKLKAIDPAVLAAAEERLVATQTSLAKVQQGADSIDIAMSQNSVYARQSSLTQAYNKLSDAYETLKNDTFLAPFDGTIGNIQVHPTDPVSPSTILAKLITKKKIATITLNEVDAAKVKVGQKVMLSFDAVTGLSVAGEVSEVDSVGTVTQGVVNYAIKITFDTQDDRVKPGMSVSTSIITATQVDVLTVPNAAVHQTGGQATVQIFPVLPTGASSNGQLVTSSVAPIDQAVQIGLANDQITEVTSGLKEGDLVVVRTVTQTAAKKTTTTSATGIGGLGGLTGGASSGGAFRAGGGGVGGGRPGG